MVVAESYARIFFRNSISTGELYPCESTQRLCEIFETGDEVEVDMEDNKITRLSTGELPRACVPRVKSYLGIGQTYLDREISLHHKKVRQGG